jgi:tRNA modification GTPase
LQQADAMGQLQKLMQTSEKLHERSRQGVLLREGLQLVIVGQPNVGKSALLNALSGKDTAIVTPIPGTTRDALAQTIHIEDVPIHVVDTAGLRNDQAEQIELVEKIGIERAWQHLEKADAVLFLHDLSRQDQAAYRQRDEALQTLIQQRMGPQQRCLHVWNKTDLIADTAAPERGDSGIWISAQTGSGLPQLKQEILATVGRQASADQGEYSGRERHLHALKAFQARLCNVDHGLGQVDAGNFQIGAALGQSFKNQPRAAANFQHTAKVTLLDQLGHDLFVVVIARGHDDVVIGRHVGVIAHANSWWDL